MTIRISEDGFKKISEAIINLNEMYAEFLASIEIERWISKDEAMEVGGCTARQLDYAAQLGRIKYMDISKRKRKYWLTDVQEYFKEKGRKTEERNNDFAIGRTDDSPERSDNREYKKTL